MISQIWRTIRKVVRPPSYNPSLKPIIGITLDYRRGNSDGALYAPTPWYVLRENYVKAIEMSGGTPLLIPYDPSSIELYRNILNGLLIPGGKFDIDPSYYNHLPHPSVTTLEERNSFEWKLLKSMLEKNKPVFGICGGMQLLNVVMGGTLIQHLPDHPTLLNHMQIQPQNEPQHHVDIVPCTLLSSIFKEELSLKVNSTHHQAIDSLGNMCTANAYASDGTIEGIECPAYNFCLGVQWHPEFLIHPEEINLFQRFIESCS